ncbi:MULTISPECIES: hypothetical protein [Clostridium]|uniref:Uncharacterized protein n=1 Tax=Clostridium cibarium TaxID=2762247 RepID=A0ABR8PSL6_9CLOT|nr:MULTISPECIES: hypothetical protein [Clostridium]MBD7911164.1 hypothetical protein [Clostridium cibarium]
MKIKRLIVSCSLLLGFMFCGIGTKAFAAIKVSNNAGVPIEVAINKWGKSGSTDFWKMENNHTDTWDRTDSRGFLMVVKINDQEKTYFIGPNSNIIVSKDSVSDHKTIINPIYYIE